MKFSDKNINTVSQLYDSNHLFINWGIIKERYKLQEETYFRWVQLISAIPRQWKDVKQNTNNADNLLNHYHHIIRGPRMSFDDKLTSSELYYLILFWQLNPLLIPIFRICPNHLHATAKNFI